MVLAVERKGTFNEDERFTYRDMISASLYHRGSLNEAFASLSDNDKADVANMLYPWHSAQVNDFTFIVRGAMNQPNFYELIDRFRTA